MKHSHSHSSSKSHSNTEKALKKRVTFVDEHEASKLLESVFDPPDTDERTPFLQDKRWQHTPHHGDDDDDDEKGCSNGSRRRKMNLCRALFCQDTDTRALAIAFVMSTLLFLGQVVVGTLGHSLAVLADSGHTGADAATYLVNLYAEYTRFSSKASDAKRIGLWAAAISTCVMVAMASFMTFEAVGRLLHFRSTETPPDAASMLGIGLFGLFVDGSTLFFFLHSSSHHGHSHGGLPCEHSHSSPSKSRSTNVLAAMVHVIGDLTRSVTVVIGGIISLLGLADPNDVDAVCSIIVFIVIAIGAALVCEKIAHAARVLNA
jgi:cation diffusion facilitator family transporter